VFQIEYHQAAIRNSATISNPTRSRLQYTYIHQLGLIIHLGRKPNKLTYQRHGYVLLQSKVTGSTGTTKILQSVCASGCENVRSHQYSQFPS
jgi:hypothetical protein